MAQDHRAGRKAIRILAIALFAAAAAIALPGCLFGDDDEVTTLTETVPPTVTEDATKDKKKKKDGGDEASGAAPAGGACGGGGGISKLTAAGTSCTQARAVAKQWERMQDSCNTIDDPNSPQGYRRTCTVSGYRCTARRDTRSDKRNVSCTKGGAKIRFTFLG